MSLPDGLSPVVINETNLTTDEIKQLRSMGFEVAEQGTEEWLEERLGMATASRFYDIYNWTQGTQPTKNNPMGTPPKPQMTYYKYRNELVAERLNGKCKRFSSKPMEWGKTHEQDAALEYERITGNEVSTLGFIKHPELDAGASLDRTVGEEGLLEIKCPNTDTMVDYIISDGPPPQYYCQMQGQMWIANKQWGDFVVFDPTLGQIFIKRISRDEEYITTLIYRIERLLLDVDKWELKLREDGYGTI